MESAPALSPFPPTRWTLVLKTRDEGHETSIRRALAELCRDYWYPLYAFARRRGRSPADAEDLTQGFFAYLLARNLFAEAEPQLGKLRTFLLTAFERYLRDVQDGEHAQKRGGGHDFISLDPGLGEDRYGREPADHTTPEKLYAKSWAFTVLQTALRELAAAEAKAKRGAQFRALEPFLSIESTSEPSYAEAAAQLSLSEAAVRQLVSRLRKQFRDVLRQQIADTLRDPSEAQVEEELASLCAALRG